MAFCMDGGLSMVVQWWWVAGRGGLWHLAWMATQAGLRGTLCSYGGGGGSFLCFGIRHGCWRKHACEEHFVRTVMLGGGAGSSLPFSMDGGLCGFARNTLFVRWWWVTVCGPLWHLAWVRKQACEKHFGRTVVLGMMMLVAGGGAGPSMAFGTNVGECRLAGNTLFV